MKIELIKINRGKWKYELVEDFAILLPPYSDFIPQQTLTIDKHKYFTIQIVEKTGETLVKIKSGYAWDGATGLPDLLQTKDLQIPSLVHDVFCQATNEDLLSWNRWREYGDDIFKTLYEEIKRQGCGIFFLRKWFLYTAIRINSIYQGWKR